MGERVSSLALRSDMQVKNSSTYKPGDSGGPINISRPELVHLWNKPMLLVSTLQGHVRAHKSVYTET